MYIVLFFIVGLVLGSFYNVVGLRVPEKKSINYPGSHCTTCKRPLTTIDLIPVLSYILSKGKCRTCHSRISVLYPIIELSTGLLFAYSYIHFGFSSELIGSLIIVSLLMILFVSDLTYMLIPDKILLFFAPMIILYRIWVPADPWWDAVIGSLVGFGLLFLIGMISKGGMGGGDIKLFAVLGIFFGWKGVLLILFLASLVGSFVGVVLLILKKVKRKQHVPFGPFIVIAALIALFWGDLILEWYFN